MKDHSEAFNRTTALNEKPKYIYTAFMHTLGSNLYRERESVNLSCFVKAPILPLKYLCCSKVSGPHCFNLKFAASVKLHYTYTCALLSQSPASNQKEGDSCGLNYMRYVCGHCYTAVILSLDAAAAVTIF